MLRVPFRKPRVPIVYGASYVTSSPLAAIDPRRGQRILAFLASAGITSDRMEI